MSVAQILNRYENHLICHTVFLTGAFQFCSELQTVRLYQSTGGLHIFVVASEIIYFLFIIYYMFVQVHKLYLFFANINISYYK